MNLQFFKLFNISLPPKIIRVLIYNALYIITVAV